MARALAVTIPSPSRLVRAYYGFTERLTPRGQYLFWVLLVLAVLGLDTRRTHVFQLFALAAGLWTVAALHGLLQAPRVRIECQMPARATALTPLAIKARVVSEARRPYRDLLLTFPRPYRWGSSITYQPRSTFLTADPGKPVEVTTVLEAKRRGRYLLRGPAVRRMDSLRMAGTRATARPDQILLVYPRYYSMEEFRVPLGRRYQPGGIPLTSSTGDAIEFVGTREYREGDPVKTIHWRSWARRGEPVVKEYQEEYFCRIALILDTFLPRAADAQAEQSFEAAISVVASIADYFSRSEYIVDILAAGPDIYQVSAGRSLAYLENILDVLACLEPCYDPPFEAIGPHLFNQLAQITTVVAVLQDWDAGRENFLRQVAEQGSAVRAMIVHEGPTRQPWQSAGDELGEIAQMAPGDVERLLGARK